MATKTLANALSRGAKELRIHLCKTSDASSGARCVLFSERRRRRSEGTRVERRKESKDGRG